MRSTSMLGPPPSVEQQLAELPLQYILRTTSMLPEAGWEAL